MRKFFFSLEAFINKFQVSLFLLSVVGCNVEASGLFSDVIDQTITHPRETLALTTGIAFGTYSYYNARHSSVDKVGISFEIGYGAVKYPKAAFVCLCMFGSYAGY